MESLKIARTLINLKGTKIVSHTFRVRFAGSLSWISLMRILIVHQGFVYNEGLYSLKAQNWDEIV
jgi:hypothetical protein